LQKLFSVFSVSHTQLSPVKLYGPSSSSSLARQPCVDPDLPQKLLPAKDPAIASSDFVTSLFQGGVVSPHAQPLAIPEGRCFLSGLSHVAD
jgi:hypothetical protein